MAETRAERAARAAAEKKRGLQKTKKAATAEKVDEPPYIPPKPGKVEVYYQPDKSTYYANNDHGEFQKFGKEELGSLLISQGYSDNVKLVNGLTALKMELLRITRQNSVHFAGPLGGYRVGTVKMFTTRVLVTRGPEILEPRRGNCDNLTRFYTDLFGKDRKYFYGWLKTAIESLREGPPWAVGQLLAVAGPPSAGKSVFQELITPMLGGRLSNPYSYLKGGTNFNEEVYAAEHGHLGDEHADPSPKMRRNLGAAIKKLVAEPVAYVHGKQKTPYTLTPFLRLTMSLNDNPQSLSVLPSFDSDVVDKIILMRARADGLAAVKKRFRKWRTCKAALMSEIPAFLWKMMHWEIPDDLLDDRWGVKSFHDPELVKLVTRMSEEERLLELVDAYVFDAQYAHGFKGTAFELEKKIKEASARTGSLNFFRHGNLCGDLLTTLSRTQKDRVAIVGSFRNRNVYEVKRVYEELPP